MIVIAVGAGADGTAALATEGACRIFLTANVPTPIIEMRATASSHHIRAPLPAPRTVSPRPAPSSAFANSSAVLNRLPGSFANPFSNTASNPGANVPSIDVARLGVSPMTCASIRVRSLAVHGSFPVSSSNAVTASAN